MTQQTLPGVALTRVEYYSNNSGGYDWLDAGQWDALRAAGWTVRGFDRKDTRMKYAVKAFATLDAAVEEWTALTGENPYAIGCTCCGRPHEFRTLTPEEE